MIFSLNVISQLSFIKAERLLKMFLQRFLILFISIFAINADECGKVKVGSGLSVGGEFSTPGQWPWLASLFHKGKYHCGSSLISKKHLLSGKK
jgi:hypothetical protein